MLFPVNVNVLGRTAERIGGAARFGHSFPRDSGWSDRCLFALAELGVRGDLVSVEKSVGRNRLLPQGLAVYASPENKKLFEEEKLVSSETGRGD